MASTPSGAEVKSGQNDTSAPVLLILGMDTNTFSQLFV